MRLDMEKIVHHDRMMLISQVRTVADRRGIGRALRDSVSRRAHAVWAIPAARHDPIATLQAHDSGRLQELLPLRYGRMKSHAYAFLRGSGAIMSADLATLPASGLNVISCGDAHLGNFGPISSATGQIFLDITDFDETMRAPFEWDVKRLAVSIMVAARVRGVDDRLAQALARHAATGYRREMAALADVEPETVCRARVAMADAVDAIDDPALRARERQRIRELGEATLTGFGHLVHDGDVLVAQPPHIYRLPQHEAAARDGFAVYQHVLTADRSALLRRYKLRDVAFKTVGMGNIGAFCAIGLFVSGDGHRLLLQIKQAEAAYHLGSGSPCAGFGAGANDIHEHDGQRIVAGQRMLQAEPDPFLESFLFDGVPFYVRQLRDPRLARSGTHLEADALGFYAWHCGRTLAVAHAKTGDAAMIAGYIGDSDKFDQAIGQFAHCYAEQNERDYNHFLAAIQDGAIQARRERRSA